MYGFHAPLPPTVFGGEPPGQLSAEFLVFRGLGSSRPFLQPPSPLAGGSGIPEPTEPPTPLWALQAGVF